MANEEPIPLDPNFRLELPNFEGPLDLLLHLIQTHALDILDLPIAFVTTKYVEYLGMMQRLNLDVAAEYLVMAATLAHIKSKSLLPKPPVEEEVDEDDGMDPREELIRRLLEYQKYKQVAEELSSRGLAGRDVFPRGSREAPIAEGEPPLAPVSLFKLLDAFQAVAERVAGDLSFEIDAERITIQERITELLDLLETKKRILFDELFAEITTTYELVVSFLAILEMGKMRLISIYQADPKSPIHIERQVAQQTAPDERGGPSEEGETRGELENHAESVHDGPPESERQLESKDGPKEERLDSDGAQDAPDEGPGDARSGEPTS